MKRSEMPDGRFGAFSSTFFLDFEKKEEALSKKPKTI